MWGGWPTETDIETAAWSGSRMDRDVRHSLTYHGASAAWNGTRCLPEDLPRTKKLTVVFPAVRDTVRPSPPPAHAASAVQAVPDIRHRVCFENTLR